MKTRKKSRKKLSLVGMERQLAYFMVAQGMPDEEICEKLNINPANLAEAKTPYFLERVKLMRLGAEFLATRSKSGSPAKFLNYTPIKL